MNNLFMAGEYMFPNKLDIYTVGYNRLLSYGYQQKLVDTLIEKVRAGDLGMDLFLAGAEKFEGVRTPSYPGIATEEEKQQMDLFLVGPEKDEIMGVAVEEQRSNILFNYIDGKRATDKYKERIKPKKLFIDSGAFSAWTKGKTIDVDEYINWINERADYIDLYGQIDVIPGDRIKGHTPEQVKEAAKATWENYLYMRPKMKKPEGLLYTFHVGEPYEYLRQALEWKDETGKSIPYIALGGMVGKPMPIKSAFLDTCFRIIKNSSNPNVKVHAFGMTSIDLLSEYPGITSADSTSWIMTGATGCIMSDVGTVSVSSQQSNQQDHYSHLPDDLRKQFEDSICKYGFTLDELAESRDKRIMHNARFMHDKIKNLTYKTGPSKRSLF